MPSNRLIKAVKKVVKKITSTRKSKAVAKPIELSYVRYDSNANQWAVCNSKHNYDPISHFKNGIMKNVKFLQATITTEYIGCGTFNKTIGIAVGDLFVYETSSQLTNLHSIGFTDANGFQDQNGEKLTKAKELILNPNRHAYIQK